MVRFTTKKIDSLTLGERMKKIRSERRLSLSEISKSTKIQIKYLESLEEGRYANLPADVYVKGFLRSYAIFMGLSESALIKQYEREKGIHKNIKKTDLNDTVNTPINFSNIVITPKMIIVGGVILLVLSSFVYLYMQVNNFVSTPRLVIVKPADGLETDSSSTYVTGVAEKDALVFINDQKVLVTENGEFSEEVGLKPGLNVINIKAKSKFDKEATQTVTVNANIQQTSGTNGDSLQQAEDIRNEAAKETFQAEIYTVSEEIKVTVEVDGELKYSGTIEKKASQNFNAGKQISVTSSNGSETFIKINGKEIGAISQSSGSVKNIVFNAEGKLQNN